MVVAVPSTCWTGPPATRKVPVHSMTTYALRVPDCVYLCVTRPFDPGVDVPAVAPSPKCQVQRDAVAVTTTERPSSVSGMA